MLRQRLVGSVAGVLLVATALAVVPHAAASETSPSQDQFVKRVLELPAVKGTRGITPNKIARAGRFTCMLAGGATNDFWPSPQWSYTLPSFASSNIESILKVNNRVARRVLTLALQEVCPRTLVQLSVPSDGWDEITETLHPAPLSGLTPNPPMARFSARVTEGALLPLGNAEDLDGEFRGYITSGKWYESAHFLVQFLDAGLQPVGGRTWIGGYRPAAGYHEIGSGSAVTNLKDWSPVRYARIESISARANSALFTLSAPTQSWVLSR